MRVLWFAFVIVSLVLLAGCGGGGGGRTGVLTGSVEGYVFMPAAAGAQLMVRAAAQAGQQPLEGALVTLRSLPTINKRTNADGYFRLDNVPVGPQQLEITSTGFTPLAVPVQVSTGVTPVTPPTVNPATYKWTVLVYMAADNDLEWQGLVDFNELEQVGSTDKVKVLVQYDRSPASWGTDIERANEDWTGSRRYEITKDTDTMVCHSNKLEDLGPTNSGSPATLHNFILWGQQYAPAEHYLVVLWDHGSGWDPYDDSTRVTQRAIGYDGSVNDMIRDVELPAALTARDHIDIVAMDACLMGMLEVGYEIRHQADYMVAAEEETPTDGFAYQNILAKLTLAEGQAMPPAQFAAFVAHDAYTEWTTKLGFSIATSSAIDLAKTPGVTSALSALAQRLTAVKGGYASALTDASLNAERFSVGSGVVFADLYDYAAQVSLRISDSQVRSRAAGLQSAVQSAVISNDRAEGHPNAHGLSVYFPGPTVYTRSGAINYYPLLQSSKNSYWDEWLAAQPVM